MQDESDMESDSERETEANKVLLRLFTSDTEEDDFNGFSSQKEDEGMDK